MQRNQSTEGYYLRSLKRCEKLLFMSYKILYEVRRCDTHIGLCNNNINDTVIEPHPAISINIQLKDKYGQFILHNFYVNLWHELYVTDMVLINTTYIDGHTQTQWRLTDFMQPEKFNENFTPSFITRCL